MHVLLEPFPIHGEYGHAIRYAFTQVNWSIGIGLGIWAFFDWVIAMNVQMRLMKASMAAGKLIGAWMMAGDDTEEMEDAA
jgi:hypothetical protein